MDGRMTDNHAKRINIRTTDGCSRIGYTHNNEKYCHFFYHVIYSDAELRRELINAAVDKFGLERIKDEMLEMSVKFGMSDWRFRFWSTYSDKKRLSEYMNCSDGMAKRFKSDSDVETSFIRTDEYKKHQRRILESIRKCGTRRDLVELAYIGLHTPMIMAFLKHWMDGIGDEW